MAQDSSWDRPYPREVWEAFEKRLDRWERRWKRRLLVNLGGQWQRMSDWESTPTPPTTLPTREGLLRDIAGRLLGEACEYVPRVLPNQPDAAPTPLGQFILAQGETDPTRFQLPEPLLGPVGEATDVLVVGLNPGYNSEEEIPRLTASLEDYAGWYSSRMAPSRRDAYGRPASRFDGSLRMIHHYRAVERDLLEPVVGPQPLGRVGVYADAIPWKWNADRHPDLNDPLILRYARGRIAEIAAVLKPKVLVTLGAFAAGALGLDRPGDEPSLSQCRVGYWEGECLPLFHPNRRWPPGRRSEYLATAQDRLRDVFSR